jgi:hypothetical protein
MNESKPATNGTPVATVVLSVVTIAAVVVTLVVTGDAQNTIIVGGLLMTFSMQVIGNIKTNENRERIEHVGNQMNGRMGELLEQTGETRELVGKAAGLIEGHAAGMKDERVLQDAREGMPKG